MMGGMIIPCRMRVRGWAWRRVEREREIERGEEPLVGLKRAALGRVSSGLREILPAHSRPWHTGVAPVCEDEARRLSVPSRRAGNAVRPARRLRASLGKDPRQQASDSWDPSGAARSRRHRARRACSVPRQASNAHRDPIGRPAALGRRARMCANTDPPPA